MPTGRRYFHRRHAQKQGFPMVFIGFRVTPGASGARALDVRLPCPGKICLFFQRFMRFPDNHTARFFFAHGKTLFFLMFSMILEGGFFAHHHRQRSVRRQLVISGIKRLGRRMQNMISQQGLMAVVQNDSGNASLVSKTGSATI